MRFKSFKIVINAIVCLDIARFKGCQNSDKAINPHARTR